MAEDIKVKLGADVSGIEKALDKVSKRKMNIPFLKTGFTKSESYKSASQTLSSLKNYTPTSSSYQKPPSSKLDTGGIGVKPLREAFRIGLTNINKKNKQDLWWKWIKGTYTVLTKPTPLTKAFASILDSILTLLITGILLPFLDDILKVLTYLLDKSVEFFNWMNTNKEKVKEVAQIGVEAIMASLGLSGLIKVFGWLSGKALALVPGFQLLSKVLAPVIEWLGEKGVLASLKGVVAFAAKFVDPLLWITLIADIGSHIFNWIKGWSDNPTWQAFWGGMADLASIVAEITDIFGWIIDIFTGRGWDRVSKIGSDIADLGQSIKSGLGMSGSLIGGDLMQDWGPEANAGGTSNATTINVSGLVDERKFKETIQSVVNQTLQRTNNIRGSAF